MTEDPRNPQDDETPDAGGDVAEPEASADPSESPAEQPGGEADAPAGGSTEGAEAAAEGQAQGGADDAAASDDDAGDAPTADAGPDENTEQTSADEPGGATAEGVNAPDEPAQAPDVVGPEGAEAAGSGAEAGAQAAGVDEDDPETADKRERPKPSAKKQGRRAESGAGDSPDVVPGAHLEPDLVLESESAQDTPDEFGAYTQTYDAGTTPEDGSTDARPAEPPSAEGDGDAAAAPAARTPLDLAADARYQATGKRKTAVARVILKPGNGTYTVNGKPLEVFFPRTGLQLTARQPLETAGYASRMDVVARLHGGGVSAQAGALRHGIARALVDADPNLRTDMKRSGFLTRDARVKERKKAGLKKARKRPQFSKR
jgi:small subunit ribosomal protein S9